MKSPAEFSITISPGGPDSASVQLVVSVDDSRAEITAVRLLATEGKLCTLPPELATLDFAACIALARELANRDLHTQGQGPDSTTESRISDGVTKADAIARTNATQQVKKPELESSRPRTRGAKSTSPTRAAGTPSDLGAVYWRLGSVPKVAKHYDVPPQIARDWIKELRGGSSWKR